MDIGGSKCAVVLGRLDKGLKMLVRHEFPTQEGPKFTIDKLISTAKEQLSQHGLSWPDVSGIGISCGGPLDSQGGRILSPPNLPNWEDVPICSILQRKTGKSAFLQNDANACALVEWKLGAGRGCDDMIFLTMGTGMGAGIIAGGRLITGTCDMAGEIGHIRLQECGPEGYGKAGSFEGFCSGGGIAIYGRMYAESSIANGRRAPAWADAEITAKLLGDAANAGDADAIATYEHVGKMLGRGISVLIDAFNPKLVVIGSIFSRVEHLLRPAMEREIKREALDISARACRVVSAQTGEQIGDFASLLVAAEGLGLRIDTAVDEDNVMSHIRQLIQLHPGLSSAQAPIMSAFYAMRDSTLKLRDTLDAIQDSSTTNALPLHIPAYNTICAMLEEHLFGGTKQ